ncbi:hypothetical protein M8C21_020760 [Ambrosia artemisiifolia]|uniref:ATP synthase subunit O, mitochondrial n=1 Tax=Ambrosia artemisiifolia TaxID=4212 RepID=A0AAD5C4M2_AMBAR|nr:hypothetical protein M8C21_020760 [Ambrosia artemisiifolia]
MAARLRSSFTGSTKSFINDSLLTQRSHVSPAVACPYFTNPGQSRNFASASKEPKVKVPVAMCGGSGNYASALYIAAAKTNALDKVESEVNYLILFQLLLKHQHFLIVLADNSRLRNIDTITKRFSDLTMAHRGEVKAVVTTVIPLPAEEEQTLYRKYLVKEKQLSLNRRLGFSCYPFDPLEIDPSIVGGLVVESGQKVFDMSIKTRARPMERFLRDPINLHA